MRQIECDRSASETTFLIDEKYTLDQGWQTGTESSGAPYYVCPYHVATYALTPMPSAVISAPPEPEPPPAPATEEEVPHGDRD